MAGSGREGMGSEVVEASLEKKYGGMIPKKKPLISKGSERAFFDSADWALCKWSFVVLLGSKKRRQKPQWKPFVQNCSPRLTSSFPLEGRLADPWEMTRQSRYNNAVENVDGQC